MSNSWDPLHCSPPGFSVMGFLRQEYWSGLPFPPSGDLSDPGLEPASPALAGWFFTAEPPGKPISYYSLPILGFFSPNFTKTALSLVVCMTKLSFSAHAWTWLGIFYFHKLAQKPMGKLAKWVSTGKVAITHTILHPYLLIHVSWSSLFMLQRVRIKYS